MGKVFCDWDVCKYCMDGVCSKDSVVLQGVEIDGKEYLDCKNYEEKKNKTAIEAAN